MATPPPRGTHWVSQYPAGATPLLGMARGAVCTAGSVAERSRALPHAVHIPDSDAATAAINIIGSHFGGRCARGACQIGRQRGPDQSTFATGRIRRCRSIA